MKKLISLTVLLAMALTALAYADTAKEEVVKGEEVIQKSSEQTPAPEGEVLPAGQKLVSFLMNSEEPKPIQPGEEGTVEKATEEKPEGEVIPAEQKLFSFLMNNEEPKPVLPGEGGEGTVQNSSEEAPEGGKVLPETEKFAA